MAARRARLEVVDRRDERADERGIERGRLVDRSDAGARAQRTQDTCLPGFEQLRGRGEVGDVVLVVVRRQAAGAARVLHAAVALEERHVED